MLRNKFKTYRFSEITSSIFSGITPKSGGEAYTDELSGISFIRSGNLNVDGTVDEKAEVWIKPEIHNNTMKNSQLAYEDILIAIVGATIGKVGIYKSDKQANINQAIAAIRVSDRRFLPEYVLCYLQSSMGQTFLDYLKRPVARANINLEEIGSIEIPLMSRKKQSLLVSKMSVSKQHRATKIREAEKLLNDIDVFMLEQLGIELRFLESRLSYALKLGDVRGTEIYCRPTYCGYLQMIHALKNSRWYKGELKNYVSVNPKTDCSSLQDEQIVSFVPMAAVGSKDNTVIYEERAYSEVKTGYTAFECGDLLWAKITPCMQNGKSCIVSDMPTQIGFGSTEFHVLRKISDKVHIPFVWALLSNATVLQAAQAVFNGSAGHQRVSDVFLEQFPLPLPDIKKQKEISDIVFAKLDEVYKLKCEAESEWEQAKEQFERELIAK